MSHIGFDNNSPNISDGILEIHFGSGEQLLSIEPVVPEGPKVPVLPNGLLHPNTPPLVVLKA